VARAGASRCLQVNRKAASLALVGHRTLRGLRFIPLNIGEHLIDQRLGELCWCRGVRVTKQFVNSLRKKLPATHRARDRGWS